MTKKLLNFINFNPQYIVWTEDLTEEQLQFCGAAFNISRPAPLAPACGRQRLAIAPDRASTPSKKCANA